MNAGHEQLHEHHQSFVNGMFFYEERYSHQFFLFIFSDYKSFLDAAFIFILQVVLQHNRITRIGEILGKLNKKINLIILFQV